MTSSVPVTEEYFVHHCPPIVFKTWCALGVDMMWSGLWPSTAEDVPMVTSTVDRERLLAYFYRLLPSSVIEGVFAKFEQLTTPTLTEEAQFDSLGDLFQFQSRGFYDGALALLPSVDIDDAVYFPHLLLLNETQAIPNAWAVRPTVQTLVGLIQVRNKMQQDALPAFHLLETAARVVKETTALKELLRTRSFYLCVLAFLHNQNVCQPSGHRSGELEAKYLDTMENAYPYDMLKRFGLLGAADPIDVIIHSIVSSGIDPDATMPTFMDGLNMRALYQARVELNEALENTLREYKRVSLKKRKAEEKEEEEEEEDEDEPESPSKRARLDDKDA